MISSFGSFACPNGIDKKLLTKNYSKEQLQFLKKTKTRQTQLLNVNFNRDMSELKHPYFDYLFKSYIEYRDYGNYPNGKSLNFQNNKLIEIHGTLQALESEQELKRLQEQDKLNNVKRRRHKN